MSTGARILLGVGLVLCAGVLFVLPVPPGVKTDPIYVRLGGVFLVLVAVGLVGGRFGYGAWRIASLLVIAFGWSAYQENLADGRGDIRVFILIAIPALLFAIFGGQLSEVRRSPVVDHTDFDILESLANLSGNHDLVWETAMCSRQPPEDAIYSVLGYRIPAEAIHAISADRARQLFDKNLGSEGPIDSTEADAVFHRLLERCSEPAYFESTA